MFSKYDFNEDRITLVGNGAKEARLGETTEFSLMFHEDKDKESIISCELRLNSEITKCTVNRTELGQCKVSYLPTQRGIHELHIKVDSNEYVRSPNDIAVIPSVQQRGEPTNIIKVKQVPKPSGVAIYKNGNIIVAEERLRRVSMYNASRNRVCSFESSFQKPCGVAVNDSNILVTDIECHCISVYTPNKEGGFIKTCTAGSFGTNQLEFDEPMGIGVHPKTKNIYVTDHNNHRVQVLDQDLNFLKKFGRKGSGYGQFDRPWGVAFDTDGLVYVTDSGNHRIQVFKDDGTFLRLFGGEGSNEGQLSWPSSLAVDSGHKLVYVTEDGNHRVSVFTPVGDFVTSFGNYGTKNGEFCLPHGIAVDEYGINIYVTDHHNDRLQIF